MQLGLQPQALKADPHLTLTLSPPIGWERRGDSRRKSIVGAIQKGGRQTVPVSEVTAPANARLDFAVATAPERGQQQSTAASGQRQSARFRNITDDIVLEGSAREGPGLVW